MSAAHYANRPQSSLNDGLRKQGLRLLGSGPGTITNSRRPESTYSAMDEQPKTQHRCQLEWVSTNIQGI
jgi:hypothetical protein